MGWVGCYVLDIYCDDPTCSNYEQVADGIETRQQAFTKLRLKGWWIGRNIWKYNSSLGLGTCFCPKHARQIRKKR